MKQSVHGFTLLRNAIRYDYPFRESIQSLLGLCDSVEIALGKSDDGTEAEMEKLSRVHLVPTVWDESSREGGKILSEQTNIALKSLRSRVPSGWGFYLQADEVISEQDYARILDDLARADADGCDVVSFRYLHFWQRYDAIAVDKRWYPQEIRAVRLDSGIESYGDAQSFRGWKKRFESDAIIYHYGHVREAKAYERKKNDFHRWWHPEEKIAEVIARGEKEDRHERTLRYLGPHPAVMKARIERSQTTPGKAAKEIFLFGNRQALSPQLLQKIESSGAKIHWIQSERELRAHADAVLLEQPSLWLQVLSGGRLRRRIPTRMASPQAREWPTDFIALLSLSEKGIALF